MGYKNLGQWLDNLNQKIPLLDNKITPVCYSNSFSIRSFDLLVLAKRINPTLKALTIDIKRNKLYHYVQRIWASIFSHHIPENKMKVLMQHTSYVNRQTYGRTGALQLSSKETKRILDTLHSTDLWKVYVGDVVDGEEVDYSKLRLSLVISYCNEDMSWMKKSFGDLPIQSITIYSKCNSPMKNYIPPGAKIVNLPNVGRNDQTYAHWMKRIKREDASENHLVLFFKASRFLAQGYMYYRPLKAVIRVAMRHGFACEAVHTYHSFYHYTTQLKTFSLVSYKEDLIKSNYSNMGEWLDRLGIELPSPITPVCYAGNFVAKASQIYAKRDIWKRLARSLMRGNSIEEGHFAERSWAGLLSYNMTKNETDILNSIRHKVTLGGHGFQGALFSDEVVW